MDGLFDGIGIAEAPTEHQLLRYYHNRCKRLEDENHYLRTERNRRGRTIRRLLRELRKYERV